MDALLKGIGFGIGLGAVLVGSVFACGYFAEEPTPEAEKPNDEPAPDTTAE